MKYTHDSDVVLSSAMYITSLQPSPDIVIKLNTQLCKRA